MTVESFARRWIPAGPWPTRLLVGVALVMSLVHLVGTLWTSGTRGATVKGDARAYFAYLPSLVFDRDLDLRNQFAVLRPEGVTDYPFGIGRDGRAANPFPVAPAIMWLPGYVSGVVVDAGTRVPAGSDRPLGYGAGAVLGAALWSIVLVGLGAELTRRLVAQVAGGPEAFAATIMAWVATPALYYTIISPLYSHAPAWVAVAAMLWLTWRAALSPLRSDAWFWSGLAAGWMVAVRLQDVPLLAVPLVALAVSSRALPNTGAQFRTAGAWWGGLLVGYLVQGLASYWMHGTVVPFGGAVAPSAPTASDLAGILFSVGYRGWISWTPVVLPALVGLVVLGLRGDSAIVRWFAVAGLAGIAGIVAIDVTHPFGAGAAYGARRYVSVTPLVALGLAAWLSRSVGSRARALAWVAFPALTVWNLWLLASYECLVVRHRFYPTLAQAVRHAVGLGPS